MTDINFGSTYRIPITQAGVNAAKKEKLRDLITSYPNGLIGKSKVGHARVSIPDIEDNNFVRKLKSIGYKVFQRFEGENIPKHKLDKFIKEKLIAHDYVQKGKNQEKLPRELKEKRRYERSLAKVEPEEAKLSETDENLMNLEKSSKIKGSGKKVSKSEDANVPVFESMELPTPDEIRQSPSYLKLVEEDGKEFAEAVFFGIK
ncbi:hypothetical protein HDR58_06525 [bacterium]|nr:hypothetical protein [bacterium]